MEVKDNIKAPEHLNVDSQPPTTNVLVGTNSEATLTGNMLTDEVQGTIQPNAEGCFDTCLSDNEEEASEVTEVIQAIAPDPNAVDLAADNAEVIVGEHDPGAVLWDHVARLMNMNRRTAFYVGELLAGLQERYRYAKNGKGFVARLLEFAAEWGFAVSTLYERLNFYKRVKKATEELDQKRIGADELARWGMSAQDWASAATSDNEKARAVADAEADRLVDLSKLVNEQLAAARQRMGTKAPSVTLKVLGLTAAERKLAVTFKQKIGHGRAAASNPEAQQIDSKDVELAFSRWQFNMMSEEAAKYGPASFAKSSVKRKSKVKNVTKASTQQRSGGNHA